MKQFKFGDRVDCDVVLVRKSKRQEQGLYRKWEPVKKKIRDAIFLGKRYLKNGHVHYGGYEDGYYFVAKEQIKAAQIAIRPNGKPVYVPFEKIRRREG